MKKRIVSIFLAAVMVMLLLPMTALAEQTFDPLKYHHSDGPFPQIEPPSPEIDDVVVDDDALEQDPPPSDDPDFPYFQNRTPQDDLSGGCGDDASFVYSNGELVISGSGRIGDYAFESWYDLKSVIIEEGITAIGFEAFYECTSLESVTIPSSVTTIEEWAFGYCELLEKAVIPNGDAILGECSFGGCSENFTIISYKGGEVEKYAKDNNTNFEEIENTNPTGSTISNGNIYIIIAAAVVVVGVTITLIVVKKKKKL